VEIVLKFIAPIPVGHRVRIIHAQRWQSPLFGGSPSWQAVDTPILVDLDTGILYVEAMMSGDIVPSPFGFKPNTGYQIASVVEGRVTHCLIGSHGGSNALVSTNLAYEPAPQGYRA
jgi:hypothetical protein